jgi:maltose alpha-D-glucosyltransferase/alpha-amylase
MPIWAFIATQAGPPTVYYGDEIGMRFVEGTPCKEGSTLLGVTAPNAGAADGERSGTRTPMQWSKGKNDGFSTADSKDIYLPIDPDKDRPDVESQLADSDSLINFVKKLFKLRIDYPALAADGDYKFLNPDGVDYPLVYAREYEGQRCVVAINPTKYSKNISVDYSASELLSLVEQDVVASTDENKVVFDMAPFSFGIFEVKS